MAQVLALASFVAKQCAHHQGWQKAQTAARILLFAVLGRN